MGNEVQFESTRIRREGNRILLDWFRNSGFDMYRPDIVLMLTEDGGIDFDPEWKKGEEQRQAHEDAWTDLVREMNLGDLLSRLLLHAIPPLFIADPTAMLQYLQAIATGEVKVDGIGKLSRDLLHQAIEKTYPKGKA